LSNGNRLVNLEDLVDLRSWQEQMMLFNEIHVKKPFVVGSVFSNVENVMRIEANMPPQFAEITSFGQFEVYAYWRFFNEKNHLL
jgi:hypothetical protein